MELVRNVKRRIDIFAYIKTILKCDGPIEIIEFTCGVWEACFVGADGVQISVLFPTSDTADFFKRLRTDSELSIQSSSVAVLELSGETSISGSGNEMVSCCIPDAKVSKRTLPKRKCKGAVNNRTLPKRKCKGAVNNRTLNNPKKECVLEKTVRKRKYDGNANKR
jgi:hypothetical protein